jgi:hypothetical protein
MGPCQSDKWIPVKVLWVPGTVISGSLSLRTAHPQVADGGAASRYGGWLQNISRKQSQTAEKGWSSSLGVGEVLTTHHRKNLTILRNGYMSLGFGLILRYNLRTLTHNSDYV